MYAGGQAGRAAEIEAGVDRHIGDVRLDISDSAERLLGAFADFPDEGLTRELVFGAGTAVFGWEIPLIRIREIEIHHVDVDAGYTPAHWSEEFANRTLDQLAPFFRDERDMPVGRLTASDSDRTWEVAAAGPALTGPTNALLAWLTGRSSGDGLQLDTGDPVPVAPTWR
jgi:maleylpyruvate isomerase